MTARTYSHVAAAGIFVVLVVVGVLALIAATTPVPDRTPRSQLG